MVNDLLAVRDGTWWDKAVITRTVSRLVLFLFPYRRPPSCGLACVFTTKIRSDFRDLHCPSHECHRHVWMFVGYAYCVNKSSAILSDLKSLTNDLSARSWNGLSSKSRADSFQGHQRKGSTESTAPHTRPMKRLWAMPVRTALDVSWTSKC